MIQTNRDGVIPDANDWRELIYRCLLFLNWKVALADVRPFLERPVEIELFTIENMERFLRRTN